MTGRKASMKIFRIFLPICLPLLLAACAAWMGASPPSAKKTADGAGIADYRLPPFAADTDLAAGIDDLDLASLEKAIDRSLQYYDRVREPSFRFGDRLIAVAELKATLLDFREIIRSRDANETKIRRIYENFDFLPPPGQNNSQNVIFTGYYVPTLEGSWSKTSRFRYPVYRKPDDLVVVNLGKFDAKYKDEQLIGRMERGEVAPYFTRNEIDRTGAIAGRNLEMLWVDDPIALYSLHVQGSGKIRLPDGRIVIVSYAQSNGRPFRSISRTLVEAGKIAPNDVSYARIQQYLRENPNELSDIFGYNERYIFFRRVERDPLGSLGLPVTDGRTVATDPGVYPKGSLALIRTRKPVFDREGAIKQWAPLTRFVLNQDAGAAIKGPSRVDIFCGDGPDSERLAGSFREKGDIYIIVRKNEKREN